VNDQRNCIFGDSLARRGIELKGSGSVVDSAKSAWPSRTARSAARALPVGSTIDRNVRLHRMIRAARSFARVRALWSAARLSLIGMGVSVGVPQAARSTAPAIKAAAGIPASRERRKRC